MNKQHSHTVQRPGRPLPEMTLSRLVLDSYLQQLLDCGIVPEICIGQQVQQAAEVRFHGGLPLALVPGQSLSRSALLQHLQWQ